MKGVIHLDSLLVCLINFLWLSFPNAGGAKKQRTMSGKKGLIFKKDFDHLKNHTQLKISKKKLCFVSRKRMNEGQQSSYQGRFFFSYIHKSPALLLERLVKVCTVQENFPFCSLL